MKDICIYLGRIFLALVTIGVTTEIVSAATPTVISYWSPSTIYTGQYTTYRWSSTNATTCVSANGKERATSGSVTLLRTQVSYGTSSITCTGPDGSKTSYATLNVVAYPKPRVTSSWNPSTIFAGEKSTYSWSSSYATKCVSANDTVRAPRGSVTLVRSVVENGSAVITCTGSGGSTSSSAPISVLTPPKPTVTSSWNPSTILAGEESTYSWSSNYATECISANGTERAPSGSIKLIRSVVENGSAIITCTGLGGSTSSSAPISVLTPPKPTVTSSWNPSTILAGEESTYSWSSNYATECISANGTERAPSGSVRLVRTVVENGSATITCTGLGGSTSSSAPISVLAPKPTVTSSWDPSTIFAGEESTYSWSSKYATECISANGTEREPSGSVTLVRTVVEDGSATITCTGSGGSTSSSAPISVLAPKPIVTSSWEPEIVSVGQIQTYSWSSTNATECISRNGRERKESGSVERTQKKIGSFTSSITCTGPGGSTESLASGEVINTTYILPPDPGEEGDATIQGIDSNNNKIRDDVERLIVFEYLDNNNKRDYSFELAKLYQLKIDNPQSLSALVTADSEIYQMKSCLKQVGVAGEEFVLPIVMNTDARTDAFIESMQFGAGEIRSTSQLKECGE